MIGSAARRIVFIAPAMSCKVADALVARMNDAPSLSMTIIVDADPEVYRMGYGEVAALTSLREAAAASSLRLREQPGLRIGLVIADDKALAYAPVSGNIEAGSTSPDKPNAIVLDAAAADTLALRAGVVDVAASGDLRAEKVTGVATDASLVQNEGVADGGAVALPPVPEIGGATLTAARVAEMQKDLARTPPLPVDLTRKLRVFVTRMQYVELKANGYQLSRRRTELPKDFFGMASSDLKERVTGRIRTPIDNIGKLEISIFVNGVTQKLNVDEKFLHNERSDIEKALTHVMPKRGRIILRRDRLSFDAQIERFEKIIVAYQSALAEHIERTRAKFKEDLVNEFLDRWKESPPSRYARRLSAPTEEDLRNGIERDADLVFDQIVKLDRPDISVIYKDIALEDLSDETFMNALRDVMAKGGVRDDELAKLLEHGEAAAAQGSFASKLASP
jgi:hypothetical protein